MAVVPILVAGFEERRTEIFTDSNGVSCLSDYPHTGTRACKIARGTYWAYWDLPIAYSQLRFAAYFYVEGFVDPHRLLRFKNGSANNIVRILAYGTDGMELEVKGSSEDTVTGVIVAGEYMHLAVDIKVHTSGWVKVYHNFQEVMSYSGDTSGYDVNRVVLDSYNNSYGQPTWWDDVVLWNTSGETNPARAEPTRLYPAFGMDEGDHKQGVGYDGDSDDNWQHISYYSGLDPRYRWVDVDESGKKDTHAMDDLDLTDASEIEFVALQAWMERTNPGAASDARLMLDDGSNEAVSGDLSLDTTEEFFQYIFEQQPDSSEWNVDDWNDMQAGIEGRGVF